MISTFQLPMPPSINHYYGHCVTRDKKPRIYIMPKGLWYRQQVYFLTMPKGLWYRQQVYFLTANKIKKLDNPFWDVPLYAYIKFFPRYTGRDIDNPLKCLFDALTKNHIWKDDKQVKKLFICWHDKSCSKNNLEISICNDKSEYYKFLQDKIMEDETSIIQPCVTEKMRIK